MVAHCHYAVAERYLWKYWTRDPLRTGPEGRYPSGRVNTIRVKIQNKTIVSLRLSVGMETVEKGWSLSDDNNTCVPLHMHVGYTIH